MGRGFVKESAMRDKLEILLDMVFNDCIKRYMIDSTKRETRNALIVFSYDFIKSLFPVITKKTIDTIFDVMSNKTLLKNRMIKYIVSDISKERKLSEWISAGWTTEIFNVGTCHTIQDIEWYKKNTDILDELGYTNDGVWKNMKLASRLQYAGMPVMIASRNGNKVRISQDGGIHEWDLIELIGYKRSEDEEQRTSDSDSLC